MKIILLLMERWPLIFRSFMYFALGVLPILHIGFEKFYKGEEHPTTWSVLALVTYALYEGLVALRAYHDGSAQRINDAIVKKRETNGFDTSHVTKEQVVDTKKE